VINTIIIINPSSYHYLFLVCYIETVPSSSHYPGEMAIRIDYYPAGELFLTLTPVFPRRGSLGYLWTHSSLAVPASAALSGISPRRNSEGLLNTLPIDYATTPFRAALYTHRVSGLNRTTRLRGRQPQAGQLSDRLRSMIRKCSKDQVLNRLRQDYRLPGPPRPVASTFLPGLPNFVLQKISGTPMTHHIPFVSGIHLSLAGENFT